MKIFYLPDLGEGLPDAEIREWLIKEGDEVNVDQPIVSMETAKALVDVPSPYSGKISKLHGNAGDVIKTGSPLVSYEQLEKSSSTDDAGTVVGSIEVGDKILREKPTGILSKVSAPSIRATPAVRALAKELGVDLENATASGPGGTITIQDVRNTGEKQKATQAEKPLREGFEPLQGARRAMAVNMAQAHAQVVPVTLIDDADIEKFSRDEDVTLRLIRAILAACSAEPALNAHFDGSNLSRKLFSEVNIGLAVDTPKGLYVPVLKNAHHTPATDLREQVNHYKKQASEQDFSKESLQGATITLSNFGIFAGRYANPIVVPPTVAIIAVGKLRTTVVSVDHKIEAHRIMPISLTFDHRAITGGEAARFLAAFISDLER